MADLTDNAAEKLFDGGNVPVNEAAKVMHKDPMFVRIGLQRGILPFGAAIKKGEHGKQYDYYISPLLFYLYTGYKYTAPTNED